MKKTDIKHQDENKISGKISGVLLVNLGTPDAPTYFAVQRYLREFLSDRRVIEIPRFIWRIILYGFILPFRPFFIAKKYASVWLKQGSPLLVHTKAITEALQNREENSKYKLAFAMRYGHPSVAEALKIFKGNSIKELIILPLYPQYSATTTGSTFDAVSQELQTWRMLPAIKFIASYADHPLYIQAIADSIKQYWASHSRSEKLLISFHGLPERNIAKGDPYYDQCCTSAQLIAEKLQLSEHQWEMVFQSRFGKAEWLKPYCLDALNKLGKIGVKSIDIVCPGFPADCLETLEEISISYAEAFHEAGGETLHYIPALNASELQINLLSELIKENT